MKLPTDTELEEMINESDEKLRAEQEKLREKMEKKEKNFRKKIGAKSGLVLKTPLARERFEVLFPRVGG